MDNPTKTRAIELAAEHERNLTSLLDQRGMTRGQLIMSMMKDRNSISPALLKEVYYLDAYAKLVNLENHEPEIEEWTAINYLDPFVEKLYVWAQKSGNDYLEFCLKNEVCKDLIEQDEELFSTTLAMAVARQLRINDEREQDPRDPQLLTYDSGSGAELEPGDDSTA